MSTKFDKMIEIITAMKEGKEIQCRFANSMDKWTLTDMCEPNFQEYEYRIYHAMPKFRVALMFDADLDYYYTFTVNKESDEQALQVTPKFINWVIPWTTCQTTEEVFNTTGKYRVGLFKNRDYYTVTMSSDDQAKLREEVDESFIRWLTDWIEYKVD